MNSTLGKHSDLRAITLGDVAIEPGQVGRARIPLSQDIFGHERFIPALVAHGLESGPIVWLNGTTHGDEPEGALAVFKVMKSLDAKALRGTVVGIPVMNVNAVSSGTRGDVLDDFAYDMNRIYPGRPDGFATERAADAHWSAMREQCDAQINIHSGGEHSVLAHMVFAAGNQASYDLAYALGPSWPLVFTVPTGGGNPTSVTGELGKASVAIEAGGGARTLGGELEGTAAELADGILNVLRHYDMISGEALYASEIRRGHQIALSAPRAGLFVGGPTVTVGAEIESDCLIGEIYDLFGDVIAEIRSPESGVLFGLRYRASVREGEWCCFLGVIDEIVSIPRDQ
jgi:uncharacterized protein